MGWHRGETNSSQMDAHLLVFPSAQFLARIETTKTLPTIAKLRSCRTAQSAHEWQVSNPLPPFTAWHLNVG